MCADDNQAQAGHLQAVVGTIAAHSFTGGAVEDRKGLQLDITSP